MIGMSAQYTKVFHTKVEDSLILLFSNCQKKTKPKLNSLSCTHNRKPLSLKFAIIPLRLPSQHLVFTLVEREVSGTGRVQIRESTQVPWQRQGKAECVLLHCKSLMHQDLYHQVRGLRVPSRRLQMMLNWAEMLIY